MAEKGEYDVQNVGPQYRRGRLYSVDTRVPHIHAQMANTRLEYLSLLNVFAEPFVVRNTGIICTIGEMRYIYPMVHGHDVIVECNSYYG